MREPVMKGIVQELYHQHNKYCRSSMTIKMKEEYRWDWRAAHRGPFFGVLAETIVVPRGGRQVDLALRDQAVGGRKVDSMKESYHKIGIGL